MHPSKLPILIEQVLYHAEFWYLIAASYTRRVDLILLDQQIRILPADAKHFLKMLHRHHIRVVLEHRQIPLRLSVRLFLNQSAGCDLAHSCPLFLVQCVNYSTENTICKVPAVAEADLRLVDDVLVEVPGDQLHPLALHAPLVDLAGVDQLAAVDDRKLVRWVDTNENIGVQGVQTR